MAAQTFDVVVVGAGPAGYVAAIRAAQLGFKTALVEKRKTLGGTCLNVGCIPSKALLDSSEKYHLATHGLAAHGITVGKVSVDVPAMIKRKDDVVAKMTGGVAFLMKKNKVTVINGWGKLTSATMVSVDNGAEELTAKHIILAAGSEVIELPHLKFDGTDVLSSTEALNLTSVPKHLIVVGAGVIGLEMGSVWSRLGAKVTLVDVMDRILTVMDRDVTDEAQKIFAKQGLDFKLGAKVIGLKKDKSGLTLDIEEAGGNVTQLTGDKVLVAVGRRPNTDKLGLADVGVKLDNRGRIEVDSHYRTNVPGVYAVGDCIQGPMLAHKAEEEGVAVAELIAGQAGHVNYNAIPWVVYTWPEIAGVGYSEDEAKQKGHEVKVGKFTFRANGRATAMGEVEGFCKIIADATTDRLLGMHIIGANASEMIAEGAIAMEFAASAEDLARSVHAHPTLAEIMKEAALAVDKRSLHS